MIDYGGVAIPNSPFRVGILRLKRLLMMICSSQGLANRTVESF